MNKKNCHDCLNIESELPMYELFKHIRNQKIISDMHREETYSPKKTLKES